MTKMVMVADQLCVRSLELGNYQGQFYMASPWQIRIAASTDGSVPLGQTLFAQVQ